MSNDPPHERDQDTRAVDQAAQGGWASGTCQPTAVTEALTRLRVQHPGWLIYQGPTTLGSPATACSASPATKPSPPRPCPSSRRS